MAEFFDSYDFDQIRSVAGKEYDKSAPETSSFQNVRNGLYALVDEIKKHINFSIEVVRREKFNRQAGRGASHNNFADYILVGVAPSELAMSRSLFVKIAFHLHSKNPALTIQLDADYASKRNKLPIDVLNYVREIRSTYEIPLKRVLSLSLSELAEELLPHTIKALKEYEQAYNYHNSTRKSSPSGGSKQPPPTPPGIPTQPPSSAPGMPTQPPSGQIPNVDEEGNFVYASSSLIIQGETQDIYLNTDAIAEAFSDVISKSTEHIGNISSQEDRFYGIFGQWGRGKTFFWNLVKQHLRKNAPDKYEFVDFHAWKYQDTPSIWAYLYEVFADSYYKTSNNLSDVIPVWFQNLLKSHRLSTYRNKEQIVLARVGFFSFLFLLGSLFSADYIWNLNTLNWLLTIPVVSLILTITSGYKALTKPLISKARNYISKYTKRNSFKAHLGVQHEIQNEFVYLLKAWQNKSQKTFVLFIDDIDRCDERRIIQIVDSIRVLLNEYQIQKRLIVVAAIDERILSEAIRSKYDEFVKSDDALFNVENLSAEYLDKLFIAGIKLEPLSNQDKEDILSGFLKGITDFDLDKDLSSTGNDSDSEDQDGSDEDDDGQDSIPNIDSTKSEDLIQQIKGELHPDENHFLVKMCKGLTNATPRSLRAFSIKYRLAKTIFERVMGVEEARDWNRPGFEVREKLALSILHAMNFKADYKEPMNDLNESTKQLLGKMVDMVSYYSFHKRSDHKRSEE